MAVRYKSLADGGTAAFKWENSLDKIFSPGCFLVEIDHKDGNLGLPVEFCGREHYIVGNLVVTDSGTFGPRQNGRVTGQTLMMTLRSGGTKIFTRTYEKGKWGVWRNLVEAGAFDKISTTDQLVATVNALNSSVNTLQGEGDGSVAAIVNSAVAPVNAMAVATSELVSQVVNGGVAVPLAGDILSTQGKSNDVLFLKRTTAESTTIRNAYAKIKQIGGNIVKNLADGVLLSGLSATGGTVTVENGIVVFSSSSTEGKGSLRNYKTPTQTEVVGHKYYQACLLKCSENPNEKVFVGWGAIANTFPAGHAAIAQSHTDWQWISVLYSSFGTGNYHSVVVGDKRTSDWGKIYVKNYLHIDLTEMFGAGNEPTKEECDALFSTIGALPKGLSIAQPADFKSVGYNQCDISMAMVGKTITNGTLSDGGNIIVPVPCVPCKIGVGENNGYVIGCGADDGWSAGDIVAVYYTPLNPMEVTGDLFIDKLESQACELCNGSHNVYVPACAGYLLVETKSIDELCVHFAWSGDVDYTHYEPYTANLLSLPVVPQMSEWGLAGISTSGTAARDTIDYENKKYIKRIGRIDMGTLAWSMTTVKTPDEKSTYSMFQSYTLNGKFLKPAVGKTANGMVYGYTPMPSRTVATQEMTNRSIMLYNTGYLYIRDDAYTSADAFKAAMQGVYLYYELAIPETFDIDMVQHLYLANDYGVEEFVGSAVPLAGKFFYQRTLANETRNFLDRLMAGLGVSDIVAAADRIVAALATSEPEEELPAENVDETTVG